MIRAFIILLIGCTLLGPGFAAAQQPAKEQAAVAAAERWLSLVDAARYGESWNEAAKFFKSTVNKDQWTQTMTMGRQPLGKVLSRKMIGSKYETKLEGGPDGEYVVIQFDTSFETGKAAVETVTPMKEKDGTWRVAGYYVR